ncbi:uncharacterized protein BJ171DRAFT_499628 [Polychytrium aggregatum]|uniref:uncharacterized protein n=1 Tax=Polychytrium aggregatum TaxID=110093 RepID=UPI0022FF016D|nr:uncharacterized protein BJ171DRAFT_499628 [Polychytrium aggregatum]KAI9205801.1 hypothetical protein BJ171DRAFT_499628 [Polychytrium aggregatum]
MSFPSSGKVIVKNVISGDTVVLRGRPVQGPPPEKIFSFANLVVPRIGSQREPEKEEPFGFEAREYLRRLLVGKEVNFKVEYTTNSQRDFGHLIIPVAINGETNVSRLLIKEGLAKAKPVDGRRAPTDEQIELLALEETARTAQIGLWSGTEVTRSVEYNPPEDARRFLEQYKGKPIDAIIEQVRDGSTFRVCLLLSDTQHQLITLQLSGVKAPIYRKDVPGVPDLLEPYSEEARYFVESRLLNRDVKIQLEGLSSQNTFIGTVQFPMGNISEALVAEGLAKVVDWTITMVTGGPQKLRAAEQKAKERKVRLWKDYVAKTPVKSTAGSETSFDAIVTRILTADTVQVENVATHAERKISLASVRPPKLKDAKEQYFAVEAKEFLRSRLIGKQVHINIDYIKPAEGEFDERHCATIRSGNTNIAEALITKGLAFVMRHRKDDDNRASAYDQLLLAEEKALAAGKGVHAIKVAEERAANGGPVKELPTYREPINASESAAKAKQFFASLQRAGRVAGVVENIASGSRYRIFVPSQNIKITLVLGGLRAPRAGGRPGETAEPFGNEGLELAMKKLFQRDVQFQVESQDKVGGFIGSLFLTTGSGAQAKTENVASLILEQGFARVHEYSAQQSPFGRELIEAEQKAKDARRGLWSLEKNWAQEVPEETAAATVTESRDLVVSEILGRGTLYVQVLNNEIQRLEKLMNDLATYQSRAPASASAGYTPKSGELCIAKSAADQGWYRARIRRINPDRSLHVFYIDYGNTEDLPFSNVRPLVAPFGIQDLKPQAQEARLAYLRVAELGEDWGHEARDFLTEVVQGRTVHAKILGNVASAVGSGTALNVVLYERSDSKISINEDLVYEGLATVSKDIVKKYHRDRAAGSKNEVLDSLLDAQDKAKRSRVNMWRYGDFTEDDEL